MRTRHLTRVVSVLAALAVGTAACSSSNTASSTTTTQAPNPATAPTDIAASYTTLFSFTDKSVAGKVAVIQNGAQIQSSLEQALASPLSSSTNGAKVDSTTILTASQCSTQHLPSPCARVVYDLLGASGSPVLANQTGYAVYDNGKWLVAKVTICGLLQLFYSAEQKSGSPPGC